MCGITGYVDWNGIREDGQAIVMDMTRHLIHRGPDGSGTWKDSYAAFGHARLSIIDVIGGAQPLVITSKNGSALTITYNGELYNFREVEHELRNLGHSFTSHCDTEVVLRAYDEWGVDCVKHFTGMFSFAIWDEMKASLFIARDPLGVKPLYYYRTKRGIVFGSEEKAILAHPDVTAELDTTGIAELFAMVPMTSPDGSILRGFVQVRPGHTVTFTKSKPPKTVCYWKLEALPHIDDEATTISEVRTLFESSVRSQLVSDVPLGSMLSGGVDSSAVAAFAAQNEEGLPTFAIDYQSDNTSYGASHLHVDRDTPWAEKVAGHIKSKHSSHYVSVDDLLEAQSTTLRAWGRPSYSPVNVSLYLLFKHIRESGVRTVLGGEGADEAFEGYKWWVDPEDIEHNGWPWHRTYQRADYLLKPSVRKQVDPDAYLLSSYKKALAEVPKLPGESAKDRRSREITWLTYTYYLNFLLHRVDRMSMAAGVEARVPFCDHNFVQYAWNISPEMKRSGDIEKGILRKAIEHLLPEDVVWRKKSGYPVAQMAEYQKALWQAARQLLTQPHEPIWQLVDKEAVERLIDSQEGDISEWTGLNHVSYVLEINSWMKECGVHLRG